MPKVSSPSIQTSQDLQKQLQQLTAQIEKLTGDRELVVSQQAEISTKLGTDFSLSLAQTSDLVAARGTNGETLKELDRQLRSLDFRRQQLEQEIEHRHRLEKIADIRNQIAKLEPGLVARLQRINAISGELLAELRQLYQDYLPVREMVLRLQALEDSEAKQLIRFNKLNVPVAVQLEPEMIGFTDSSWLIYSPQQAWVEQPPTVEQQAS